MVREPDGWLYGGDARRRQLRLRIEVLKRGLELNPNDREGLIRRAGYDRFFKNLNGYEQRLVIRGLELSREEAMVLFGRCE